MSETKKEPKLTAGCPVEHDENGEGCPVQGDQNNGTTTGPSNSIFSSTYSMLFGGKSQVETKKDDSTKEAGYNPLANDLKFRNEPHPDQSMPLSKKRVISTIPKGEYTPGHQPENFEKWVYPSEQQYFNAMKRKGWEANEEDMGVILAIHNFVNEKGWSQIKEWEQLRGCSNPKLKRFLGRPKDISPKAYLLNLIGYTLPFDRHDWVVDSNGEEVRYVIDFYTGTPTVSAQTGRQAPISMHLDVRPALDSPSALFYRMKFGAFEWINKQNLGGVLQAMGVGKEATSSSGEKGIKNGSESGGNREATSAAAVEGNSKK